MKTYESQCRLCAANLRMIYAIGRGYEFTAHNCADVTQPTDHELANKGVDIDVTTKATALDGWARFPESRLRGPQNERKPK